MITLSRPEGLNAFDPAMMGEFVSALDRADAADEVRAVIVTGAGRAFCAGADLSDETQRARSSEFSWSTTRTSAVSARCVFSAA